MYYLTKILTMAVLLFAQLRCAFMRLYRRSSSLQKLNKKYNPHTLFSKVNIYSALQNYWNSKDKIALLAIKSKNVQIWLIWDKTTECHILLLGDSTHLKHF